MLERVCEAVAWTLALSGGAVAFSLALSRRRSSLVGLCCTRRRSLGDWVLPWRWFVVRVCGYPLRSLAADARGLVTCPECGGASDPARPALVRRVRAWRLAIALGLLATVVGVAPSVRDGSWPRHIPTLAMVAGRRTLGEDLPKPLARELDARVWRRGVDGLSARLLVEPAIRALRDDGEKWTLLWAERTLSALGDRATPALRRALRSGDYQQRQAAASILRWRTPAAEAPPALIEATVEGLADDRFPWGSAANPGNTGIENAIAGVYYLVEVGPRVAPFLREPLRSGDAQQRLLCAVVAAFAGCAELTDLAAPVLVEHLRDNDLAGDARTAAPALYRLGPGVFPFLLPHVDAPDAQLRGLSRGVLDALGVPYEAREPDVRVRITGLVLDPIRDLPLERMEWSWLRDNWD